VVPVVVCGVLIVTKQFPGYATSGLSEKQSAAPMGRFGAGCHRHG
jgi:hypothetical protein